jgi:hypothetical protein
LGDFLLCAVFSENNISSPRFGLTYFFHGSSSALTLTKKRVGLHFGANFSPTHLVAQSLLYKDHPFDCPNRTPVDSGNWEPLWLNGMMGK